ncbi:hypothetical protein THII_1669 [Thioploca ingrica]|uniref:Uncharacterized protein n=1 Tax=Thioploca ingrica TaxID=40754 RepID=A0A090BUZ5_9GAMM|nr:hypothetical protein THII_1669 [Thioploca ingrica]
MKRIIVLVVVVVSFGTGLVWADMERVSIPLPQMQSAKSSESVKQVTQLKVNN